MRDRLAALLVAGVCGVAAAQTLPSFEQVRTAHRPSDALLLDRHGEPIGARRVDATVRRLAWVSLDEVSPALPEALLWAEDQRFWQHGGVDWAAAAAALWQHASGGSARGASTISMQVAAMLDPALARGGAPRDLSRKWSQAEAAWALERAWSKPQILEAYLNGLGFRGELQGLRAASQGLFGKAPDGLDRQDSALLAALVRAPGAPATTVARRACQILAHTRPGEPCDAPALASLLNAAQPPQPAEPLAPHAARRLLADGQTRRSSLDAALQRTARQVLAAQVAQLAPRGVEDAAAVLLDRRSGEVLAYVGSSGGFSRAAQVDAADAPRQAGSTLKPFFYALALERGLLTPATLLDDSPLALAGEAGVYAPRNYDGRYQGPVSVRRALASSLNVPAVRTVGLVGVPAAHALLRALALPLLPEPAHYGDSLALGSADVTLLSLTNAYRALANGGVWSPVRWSADDPMAPGRRVLVAPAAWLVGHMLSDNAARETTFGFDSVLATPVWSAAKTGTSKDMRDNWCIGFTEHYVLGVWVGNASGAPMRDVSGVSGAAPAWAELVRSLHRDLASRPPPPPPGLRAQAVRYEPPVEPPRDEWFLAGSVPAGTVVVTLQDSAGRPRILAPQAGALLAWDPDIPPGHQALVARHSDPQRALQWQLDGRDAGQGATLTVPLVPGPHRLSLLDAAGQVLDERLFEVRGGPGTPRASR
ncbi:penicillin-binding protein 1C [Ideonella alba]|uniref:penicillin-binding protein 1C n=1 Tax=Ideonella alba TaxID=2824118 RepID=UPI002873441F|nr:penicillin-binding protein 1C [Ideonella alba]